MEQKNRSLLESKAGTQLTKTDDARAHDDKCATVSGEDTQGVGDAAFVLGSYDYERAKMTIFKQSIENQYNRTREKNASESTANDRGKQTEPR